MSLLPGMMLNTLMVACIFPTDLAKEAEVVPGTQKSIIVQTEQRVMNLFEDCRQDIPIFTNLIVEKVIAFSIIKQ